MQNLKEAFGNNLRKIRKSKNLTIENFSEMLDITPRQLTKIESGETFLTAETLCKISLSLDVPLKNLFDFSWYDKYLYYYNNKLIKPHFKIVFDDNIAKITSLPTLKNFKINKKMRFEDISSFLFEFSKKNNMEIFIDYFIRKQRDKILKITPDGGFHIVISKSELQEKINKTKKNDDYYIIMENFSKLATDNNKIEYIKTALDALENNKSLEKLKTIIKGIELSQDKS